MKNQQTQSTIIFNVAFTATRRIVERIIGNDTCTKSTSEPSVHVSKEMAARLGPSQSQGEVYSYTSRMLY